MGRRVTCPRNHSFDLLEEDGIHRMPFPLLCPVCGVVVAGSPEELMQLTHQDGLPDTDPEIDLPPEPDPEQVSHGPPFPAHYEVIQLCGQGGMVSVFVAIHKALGRR